MHPPCVCCLRLLGGACKCLRSSLLIAAHAHHARLNARGQFASEKGPRRGGRPPTAYALARFAGAAGDAARFWPLTGPASSFFCSAVRLAYPSRAVGFSTGP